MAFIDFAESDLSRGMDRRRAENQLKPGYSQKLLNAKLIGERAVKREGYKGFYGTLPLRATNLEYLASTNQMVLTFDQAVDLSSVASCPVVLYGKTSLNANGGDFTSTSAGKWYSGFANQQRINWTTGSGTTAFESDDRPFSGNVFVTGICESSTDTDRSGVYVTPDRVRLDQATDALRVDYTVPSDKEVFVYFKEKASAAGSVYVNNAFAVGTGTNTYTILAATHGLSNTRIVPYFLSDTSGEWIQILPDAFAVNPNTGDCTVTFSGVVSSFTARVILSTVSSDDVKLSSIPAATSQTIVIPDVTSAFNFVTVYKQVSSSSYSLVLPDLVSYDASTQELSVTVYNSDPSASIQFALYYEAGEIQANKLSLTPDTAVTVDGIDSAPALCLYGIPHSGLYSGSSSREGWVTHIDSFKRQGENKIVAGLGGTFYTSVPYSSALDAYQYGLSEIDLSGRTSGDRVIGPLFHDTGTDAARTGGYITADNAGSNLVQVTAAAYNSGTGWVDLTLYCPNLAILDSAGSPTTLGSVLSTHDYVQVSSMGYDRFNGTFHIKAFATNGTDTITLSVSVDSVTTDDYDHSDAGGSAGIFSDKLVLESTSSFIASDLLDSDYFSDLTALESSGTTVYIDNASELITVPSGLSVLGTRTSESLPLVSVTGFVPGDMVTYSEQEYRVNSVDPDEMTVTLDQSISFESGSSLYVSGRFVAIEGPSGITSKYLTAADYGDQNTVRSSMVSGSLMLTNGLDPVYKYDGTNNYRAGLFRWQPGLFISLDSDTAGLSMPTYKYDSAANDTVKNELAFSIPGDVEAFNIGDRIYHEGLNQVFTIKEINATSGTASVLEPVSADAGSHLYAVRTYRYYYRLNAVDRNGNIVASAVTGLDDYKVELHTSGYIRHKLIGLPDFGTYDYDRIKVQIYRTRSTSQTLFKLIDNLNLSRDELEGYLTYTDTVSDEVWDSLPNDSTNDALLGTAARGSGWDQPYLAKSITSANGKAILGNVKSYPYILAGLIGSAANTLSNYSGLIWTLNKSDLLSGTSTDMLNTVRYKMVTTGASTIASVSVANASRFSFTYTGDLTASISAGSWVYLFHNTVTDGNLLDLAGWWQVKTCTFATGTTTITVDYTHGLAASTNQPNRFVYATNKDVPVWLGTDGNRQTLTGNSDLIKLRAMSRLAEAVNASMRLVNTNLSGYEEFVPWIIAHGGGDLSAGQVKFEQPKILSTTFSLVLPAFTGFSVFVNEINQSASAAISAVQKVFPSRLLVSYQNYPETFDRPDAPLPEQSDSVIDVNAEDGQEITTAVPFFGDSAFGASSQSGVIAVFKANSIYVVDTNRKAQGAVAGESNPVQQIDSNGLGCTVPGSVTVTKQGIMFANQNGIYRLTRSLTVEWVGEEMDRDYKEGYKNELFPTTATATHYAVGSQYKLSYPAASTDTANNMVFVFDHSLSGQDRNGSWTYYDNHPATGWANLLGKSYFGTTDGRVCVIRNSGEVTDFADEADGINFEWESRAIDFGQTGLQKLVAAAFINFRTVADSAGTQVYFALDTAMEWTELDPAVIERRIEVDNLADQVQYAIQNLRFDFRRAKCQYIQVKVSNSTKDEPVEIAGLDFKVAGLTGAFTKTARESSR